MQKFTDHSLYRYTGSKEHAPEGFKESPSLVDYLNYLATQGFKIFQVVAYDDSMWFTILTVEEV